MFNKQQQIAHKPVFLLLVFGIVFIFSLFVALLAFNDMTVPAYIQPAAGGLDDALPEYANGPDPGD